MRILIESDTQSTVFRLNDSSAAKSLYDRLPLTVTVENFGGNENAFQDFLTYLSSGRRRNKFCR